MIVKIFVGPPIENNNYLIVDKEEHEAALIDCSSIGVWDKISEENCNYLSSLVNNAENESGKKINLKYILLTHGHFDHIAGLRNSSAKIMMHKNDFELLNDVNDYMPMFGMNNITLPRIDRFIDDGDIIKLGRTEIKVIHTPGHTQGGVCYYAENNLFSGDTIFFESVGRCDLEGGNFNQLVSSIKNKIFTLPDEVKIYPGHGKQTTVGWEKENNRFA